MAGLRARAWLMLTLLAVLLGAPGSLAAGEPPSQPQLRIEAGMHTAIIKRIAVDAAERYVVTASDDKTVRIWDLVSGRLLQVLRPPLGEGNEGKIYAVAISPDGQEVICAGWTHKQGEISHCVYVMDRFSGRLVRRITGLPNVINHLKISKDGRQLAVCLGHTNGVRVYQRPNYSLAWEDGAYLGGSYWADFDNNGNLATTCEDGHIRRYDKTGRLMAKVKAPGGEPLSIAFSPDGQRLAVGYYDSSKVQVLSGQDLTMLFSADTPGGNFGNLATVAWSLDGEKLLAAGSFAQGRKRLILVWAQGGRGGRSQFAAPAENAIMSLWPLAGDRLAFASGDPAWGVLDAKGRRLAGQGSPIADYRYNLEGFRISADGYQVEFAFLQEGGQKSRFSLAQRRLTRIDSLSLRPPIISAPGLEVGDWDSTQTPSLNGKALRLKSYETSRSLALLPDRSGFIMGTDWYLRRFGRDGVEVWEKTMPAVAWAVNVAANGQVVAAALGDGTIRWFRVSDGQELLAFYPHADQQRWVLWTPSGYYDASPGGEDLIGWHVNRGKDQAADFFPAGRFREQFYRPQVVAKVLETRDEQEALRLAQAEAPRPTPQAKPELRLPPVVTITSPGDGSGVTSREVVLRYSLRNPGGEPVTKVRALIDGRPVSQDRGFSPVPASEGALTVTIPPRDVELSLIAENRFASSDPATVRLRWKGDKTGDEFAIKPKLYVLAVGVGDYRDQGMRLKYAAKDARDFGEVIKRQQGGLYREVEVRLLTDDQATREGILDGLEWIERQTTQHDVAMIMLSGHGFNDKHGTYYFMPSNVDPQRLRHTGVSMAELQSTVRNLPGKVLMFVDTCHAGNIMGGRKGPVDINAVANELASAENGAVVFSASTGNQYSLENSAWGNGAFSKALLEGLGGKADFHHTGRITINMLDLYISERVKALTENQQTPITVRSKITPDFPVAVVR